MKSGTTPNQGDIVLVPIPFTDLSAFKKRPALVLSTTAYNRRSNDIIVAGITSNPAAKGTIIPIADDCIVQGTLPVKSYVRAANVYTLDKRIIVKVYGRLDKSFVQRVLSHLDIVFGKNTTE